MTQASEENYQRFVSCGQSARKLEYALRGYFDLSESSLEQRKAYENYLRLRSRPASELLVQQDDTEKLRQLYQLNQFTEQQVLNLVQLAGREGKLSSLAWLLRLKKEVYGYRDKDFSL